MIYSKIEPYYASKDSFHFYGAFAYVCAHKSFLISDDGHCLMIDESLLNEILSHKVSQGLRRKLISRGFGGNTEKRRFFIDRNEILPEFIMIDLTNRCNMQCRYCLRNIVMGNHMISEKTVHDICNYITDYCNNSGIKDISIQPWGGEPLLAFDRICQLRSEIQPNNTSVHFSIETNGLCLKDNILRELYRLKIGIGISIDGTPSIHDQQRARNNGRGTGREVVESVLRAIEVYGWRLGTITTVTKINAPHIEDILDFFAMELGISSVKFNFMHASLYSDCNDIGLSKEEIEETQIRIFKKLVSLNRRGVHITDHNIAVKIRNVLKRQYSDICLSQGCHGGRKMVVLGMNGDIYPCELTDSHEWAVGSINDGKPLVSLLTEASHNSPFYKIKRKDMCNECPWYFFCRGGCTVRCISSKGTSSIDEIECASNRVLYPEIVRMALSDMHILEMLANERKENNCE